MSDQPSAAEQAALDVPNRTVEDLPTVNARIARRLIAAVRPHLETPLHDGVHHYLSTGCLHGDQVHPDGSTGHDYCKSMTGMNGAKRPGRCKFCDASCQCRCHEGGTDD